MEENTKKISVIITFFFSEIKQNLFLILTKIGKTSNSQRHLQSKPGTGRFQTFICDPFEKTFYKKVTFNFYTNSLKKKKKKSLKIRF